MFNLYNAESSFQYILFFNFSVKIAFSVFKLEQYTQIRCTNIPSAFEHTTDVSKFKKEIL